RNCDRASCCCCKPDEQCLTHYCCCQCTGVLYDTNLQDAEYASFITISVHRVCRLLGRAWHRFLFQFFFHPSLTIIITWPTLFASFLSSTAKRDFQNDDSISL